MSSRTILFGGGLVVLALLWGPGVARSRSIHGPTDAEEAAEAEHAPRHGGQFGDADDLYHYELLLEPGNRLVLYVNDEHNTPLDVRPLTGRWTLSPDSPGAATGSFTPSEDGAYFFADLPPLDTDPVHVAVAVLNGEVWAEMEFYLPRKEES